MEHKLPLCLEDDGGEYVTLCRDDSGLVSVVSANSQGTEDLEKGSRSKIPAIRFAMLSRDNHHSGGAIRNLRLWLCSCLQISHFVLFLIFFYMFLNHSSEMDTILNLDGSLSHKSITKRSVRTSGLLEQQLQGLDAMQLVGAIPTLQIKTNGTIGPWVIDSNTMRDWAELNHDRSELKILQTGLYFINTQIFYLTEESSNSYEIVKLQGANAKEILSVCAHNSPSKQRRTGSAAEITCCTAVITHLQNNDRLRLHQIEQNRVILFSRGFSHWGVIKIQGQE